VDRRRDTVSYESWTSLVLGLCVVVAIVIVVVIATGAEDA
jgi:hypothetical protein